MERVRRIEEICTGVIPGVVSSGYGVPLMDVNTCPCGRSGIEAVFDGRPT
jgi:hypothetical protein